MVRIVCKTEDILAGHLGLTVYRQFYSQHNTTHRMDKPTCWSFSAQQKRKVTSCPDNYLQVNKETNDYYRWSLDATLLLIVLLMREIKLTVRMYNSDAAPNTGVKINGDYTVNKVGRFSILHLGSCFVTFSDHFEWNIWEDQTPSTIIYSLQGSGTLGQLRPWKVPGVTE